MLREEQQGQHFASSWVPGGGNPTVPRLGGGRALSVSRVSSSGHLVTFLLIKRNTFMLSNTILSPILVNL